MSAALTRAMEEALSVARFRGGTLVNAGAVWTYPDCPRPMLRGNRLPLWYADESTVKGLCNRGEMRVKTWKGDRPSEVEVVEPLGISE